MLESANVLIEQEIRFTVLGTGDLEIVWIHGYCFDNTIWEPLLPSFNAKHIFVNLPGHQGAPLWKEYSIENLSKKIAVGLHKIGVQKPILVGHSMGGYTAVHLLEKIPSMGLVLFHSHPFADTPQTREKRYRSIGFIEKNGAKPFVQPMITSLFHTADTLETIIDTSIQKANLLSSQSLMYGQQAMAQRESQALALEKYTSPVLFIIGEKDVALPDEYRYKQVLLPSISQVWQGHIGHMGMYEATEQVIAELQDFFDLCKRKVG